MCGINGIFCHAGRNTIDQIELITTRDYMHKRGPDSEGEWISSDHTLHLAHRRLAIIDLADEGTQPMRSNETDGYLL